MFDVWPAGRNLRMFHIHIYGVCIYSVRNGTLMHPFVITIQNIIHVGLFTIVLYLMCVSVWLTFWVTLGFYSYVNFEVLYIFRNFSSCLWLLVHVWNFLRYLYTCRVKPCTYGNDLSISWTWLEISRYIHLVSYIVWTFITPIYLT